MKFMRKNGGFTLVELIVVIAILAILAGVAVPAYSGYINKANEAADNQLLAAVNTAFAAACIENGLSTADVTSAGLGVSDGKVVPGSLRPAELAPAFARYYAGNENTAFKVFTALEYVNGNFVGSTTSSSVAFGGGYINVSNSAISSLLDSTFYGEGMTSEKLLNQVDQVSAIASMMGSVGSVMGTEGFADATLAALGIDATGMTLAEKQAAMQAKSRELALKNLGWDADDVTSDNQEQLDQDMNRINGNALVLYTAQTTSKMSAEDAKNLLKDVDSDDIRNAMTNGATDADKANGMNQAALAYGMYYAYVNSDQCTDATLKNNIDALAVIDALDGNQEFKNYMASEQGTKDMDAYLQALGVIGSSTQSPEAVEKLVNEGFGNDDLLGILTDKMGK